MRAYAFSSSSSAFLYHAYIYLSHFKTTLKRNSSLYNAVQKNTVSFLLVWKSLGQWELLQAQRTEFISVNSQGVRKFVSIKNICLRNYKRPPFFLFVCFFAFIIFSLPREVQVKLVVKTMPDSFGSRKHNLCQVWLAFLDTCQMAPFLWKLKSNHSRIQSMNYNCSSWALPYLLSCRLAQQGTWPLRSWSPGWTLRTWSPLNKQMCTPWLWSFGKWHLAVMVLEVSTIGFLISKSMFG